MWMLNVVQNQRMFATFYGCLPDVFVWHSVIPPFFQSFPSFQGFFFWTIILDIQNVPLVWLHLEVKSRWFCCFSVWNPVGSWSNLCRFCFDSALVILMIGAVSQKGECFVWSMVWTLGGGFNDFFFVFTPDPWKDDPIWGAYFSDGWIKIHQLYRKLLQTMGIHHHCPLILP